MKIAIIYSSVTGNTKDLVEEISKECHKKFQHVDIFPIQQFTFSFLDFYDVIVIGTYTWGNGDIPKEMVPLFEELNKQERKRLVTGIAGTGDRFYPHFCGAVDRFKDLLHAKTNLAVTLKVELLLQETDKVKCKQFVELVWKRLEEQVLLKK
ncbi:flavodoxin domain-containing protein [Alkalihalobacterium bogoriense]|uniref:flavodoxin domain-containing protein n=1 Tax=Alkalihalobacterium bogoriense TaxID=246272 RepID=UPI00047C9093|nr:flavodoxin domain-containing protein [Alkalihalobacterium bogoriense]